MKKPTPRIAPDRQHRAHLRCRIGRATGKASRYSMACIRMLPGRRNSAPGPGVVLQATDGKEAVCVLADGQSSEPCLVPLDILPTRQNGHDVVVEYRHGQWQSSEGRVAADVTDQTVKSFPPIGEVLPTVHPRSYYHRLDKAKRRKDGSVITAHVVVGIDLTELTKVADGLGTSRLTLMVPVPIQKVKQEPGQNGAPAEPAGDELVAVNQPVCVCPATGQEGVEGIGAVMPLQPERANAYYEKIRKAVLDAEKASAPARSASKPAAVTELAPVPEQEVAHASAS